MAKQLGQKMIRVGGTVLFLICTVKVLVTFLPGGEDYWDSRYLPWTNYVLCGSVEHVDSNISLDELALIRATKVKFKEDSIPFLLILGADKTLELGRFYKMSLRQYPTDSVYIVIFSKEVEAKDCSPQPAPPKNQRRMGSSIALNRSRISILERFF